MQLTGKVALVTGGARRIGRAIALELGRAGAHVIVHHHESPAEAAEVVEAIGHAHAVTADLRDPGAAAALVGEGIDILVNSAAAFEQRRFEAIDDEGWDAMLALNLLAPMRLARASAPAMRARGAGVIVNIVDVAALTAWRGYAHYCVAKAGLVMLTRCLALELAPAVRTCGVAPGTVLFPESYTPAQQARVVARIPLGRTGAPADVARAVRFLCEEDFLNGIILPVDGGRLVDSGEAW